MRLIIICAALALSGCATTKLTPEQSHQLLVDLHNAGCGGKADIVAGASAGQLGGEGHFNFEFHGECPVGDIPPAALPSN